MTSLLDAYFSLSLGLKSSSMPFVAIALLAKHNYYKSFILRSHLHTNLRPQGGFRNSLRDAVLGVSHSNTNVLRGQTTK